MCGCSISKGLTVNKNLITIAIVAGSALVVRVLIANVPNSAKWF